MVRAEVDDVGDEQAEYDLDLVEDKQGPSQLLWSCFANAEAQSA